MEKNKVIKKSRIESLDWLRGLAALSIMFYHLYNWNIASLDSGSWLGRLGIYAVSIFFILSGLSMAIVYNKFIKDAKTSITFFIRRIFRIWPLLWVVTTYSVLMDSRGHITISQLKLYIANITTVFGFIKPQAYIATGAWSIGNEMVYYAITPIIIMAYNRKKILGNLVFIFSLVIGLIYAFNILDSNVDLATQWINYVNPFNNLFFYFGGIAIYYNLKDLEVNKYFNNFILFIAVMLFCFIPLDGNQIIISTSIWRIIFSLLCFIIVIGFYKLESNIPKLIGGFLEAFGVATYGVYLLHPVVYNILLRVYSRLNVFTNGIIGKVYIIISVVIITAILALISYYKFELKIMRYGKKFSLFKKDVLSI